MPVIDWAGQDFDFNTQIVIVGAGACGLCAALAARDAGAETFVLERTKAILGTTSMSTGLIPAAGTNEQRDEGIQDSPVIFARDIMAKNNNGADPDIVAMLARTSVETITWLRDQHKVPLTLVDGFLYPGHSVRRMYGTPNRTGSELMAALESAVRNAGAEIVTEAHVVDLVADSEKRIRGIVLERPDGLRESIGCEALILASCGFAGDPALVAKFIPEMTAAVPHTHLENRGSAFLWGEALGAALGDMDSYQGHGGLAYGHGVPILWPTIMEGGIQVNQEGCRFSDESQGYSEQACRILAQSGAVAWTLFDQRIYDMMMQFDDFKDAVAAKALISADDFEDLAEKTHLPLESLTITLTAVDAAKSSEAPDAFGRVFQKGTELQPPYYTVKVTGALFHTQGGLCVDRNARVLDQDGSAFPNLFAGGGAARGISGAGATGYIAGNGLLTATSLGKVAGRAAAQQVP